MPSATLNTNTVDGLIAMPVQPINPAVIINGMRFGINEQINTRNDVNKYNMHSEINRNAHKILSFNP